jgi:hypothetical protein
MRRRAYEVDGQRSVASPTKSALGITVGGTTYRPWLYDGWVGSSATPADNAIEWLWQRYTAAGTSTAVTPTALDSGDPAATSTSGINHTVEPTYTAGAILWHAAVNQRATQRFQFDPDAPLVIPAVANNGIGLQPINATFTGVVDVHAFFAE